MPATEDQLRRIAAEEARKLFGPDQIGEITASIGATFHGEDAYFLEIQLEQDGDRDEAAGKRIALSLAIRDRLVADGDETYPYVRVLSWRAEIA